MNPPIESAKKLALQKTKGASHVDKSIDELQASAERLPTDDDLCRSADADGRQLRFVHVGEQPDVREVGDFVERVGRHYARAGDDALGHDHARHG